MAMEKQCTYLIFDENVTRVETSELAQGLENNDVKVKSTTLKKIILLMLNGEQLGSLLMKVIQYVVPNDDKPLKKLLYLYLEAVEKRGSDGNLLPEMILICNMIRNDLNHPNEFVRGSALRFLSRMREKDILEPLVSSLRANLEHRHSYVRRNSVLAIYNTYRSFEELMPDAPELIGDFIDAESDVSAKRNAFVMLCNCDQERAVRYQLSVIEQISSMGEIIQLVMLELIRKVCRQDPFQKSKYVRAVFNLQGSASNSVAFECASTLVSLSSAQTAVKTAVQAYCQLLSTHSDNNVKLIVLDKLSDLQKKHPEVLKGLIMDIIRGLSSPNIDIRKKVLDLVMELVNLSNIDEVIVVLKKEIVKTQGADADKSTDYRQMLVQAIHTCVIKFPETAGTVVHVLIDFIDDSNATSASEVILFIREVVETYPRLREAVVTKLIEYFPTIKVPKVFRVALWIFSEYCYSTSEIDAAFSAMKSSLGNLPFVDEETLSTADTAAVSASVKQNAPAVLTDGTYASQSSASMAAPTQLNKEDTPSLRTLLVSGDFFVAAVTASTLTKIVLRYASLKSVDPAALNERVAEAMGWICGMVRLGKSGVTPNRMDDDCLERLWLSLLMLSDPENKNMQEIWTEKCRSSYGQLLVQKQKAIAAAKEASSGDESKSKVKSHADDLINFRQLRGKGVVVTEIEDEDALDLNRATGMADEEDFGSRLKRVMQLTGLSDPVYAEAVVTVHEYDVVLDILLINQLSETIFNVCLELATVGDLKLCERPQSYTLAAHASLSIRANIKVSSTETGIIYGNIVYDLASSGGSANSGLDAGNMVILNDIHIDIMDYIVPATCTLLQFRCMWAEFEWENKVAVNTSITDPVKYLRHIVACTNMECLTHIDEESECGFLAANLYAKSIFGEDALVNVSIEKQRDGHLGGYLRIRSKTQGIALSLGDKITGKQKGFAEAVK
uniref:Coatomer subunit beta n=1 Tax=Cryptomonas curvata TaxID=233186 RepID=A0A7S0LYG1_9CRYP|mmetsp:Transcript_12362/g.26538  ORF Transcript_12362/g.26538 Transcript_12362/m.26538 type:complete len:955 (+) Transcript_12362:87-2951(+)|eukprot:CAMPEP_0172198638 /NCGR_PEP_ID=MMETSP1050-20130122/28209_1 /TAXON_ID=233186 /ORGANISM="Cryptomonas curvata, Strain CCAP979/52" /LENGTH=954 /DNA_ID=CAMNT_0012875503 /DNA_START=92 /DNA_END=2956 /DNA_ORIENTATION=-